MTERIAIFKRLQKVGESLIVRANHTCRPIFTPTLVDFAYTISQGNTNLIECAADVDFTPQANRSINGSYEGIWRQGAHYRATLRDGKLSNRGRQVLCYEAFWGDHHGVYNPQQFDQAQRNRTVSTYCSMQARLDALKEFFPDIPLNVTFNGKPLTEEQESASQTAATEKSNQFNATRP